MTIYYTINSNNYIEDLKAPDWVQVITEVEDLGDPVRSSRKEKILCPFDEASCYIDASKVHLVDDKFRELSEEIISKGKFCYMQHPHKHSYLEECAEYVSEGWVDTDDILKFSIEVAETNYDFEKYIGPHLSFIWRPKNDKNFNELWWEWYNKGGIRDQLSFCVALQLSNIEYDYVYCRDFLNQFTDANPDGIWWKNKCGAYKYYDQEVDLIEFVDLLTEVTKLYDWTKYYRAGKKKDSGKRFFGEAGKYGYSIDWDDPKKNSIVIYTCITNWYDTIPDDMYYDPMVNYVCFTDGNVEKKGPWDFRPIPDYVYEQVDGDPRRLSAFAKICPHKLFPIGTKTVWLDGCYVHTKEWVEKSKAILERNPYSGMGGWGALTHMLHPHRFTFHNEVMEGFGANFNTREQFLELVDALSKVKYDFKRYGSPVLTCIWRTISEEMFEFHDIWWKYSLIGSNRDQISFDCAKQLTGVKWDTIPDWGTIGLDLTSDTSKIARNKRHPMAGHFTEKNTYSEILKECYDLLAEIRPITGIEDEHQIWQVGWHEVRDPDTWVREWQKCNFVPEGEWWYDPTTIKTTNGKYSIQTKINLIFNELGFQIGNKSTNKTNSFWVRRLKRSLGLIDLPQVMHEMYVWDWGYSFRKYVQKNVLNPNLPKT